MVARELLTAAWAAKERSKDASGWQTEATYAPLAHWATHCSFGLLDCYRTTRRPRIQKRGSVDRGYKRATGDGREDISLEGGSECDGCEREDREDRR